MIALISELYALPSAHRAYDTYCNVFFFNHKLRNVQLNDLIVCMHIHTQVD